MFTTYISAAAISFQKQHSQKSKKGLFRQFLRFVEADVVF